MKIFITGLPLEVGEDELTAVFGDFGQVKSLRIIKDRETGQSRGFGFVEVAAKDAAKVIQKLNDFEYEGRTLKVREAKERQDNDDSEE